MSSKKQPNTQSAEALTQPIRQAVCRIIGAAPITWGKPFESIKEADEAHDAFDERCWRERGHWDGEGRAIIPAEVIHASLIAAGSWLSEKLRGSATFKKRFAAGTRCPFSALIEPERTRDEVGYWFGLVPANPGKPGGARVMRHFPRIDLPWAAELRVVIVDGLIGEDTFERHLRASGMFDGYGTHRPGSGKPGGNGVFRVEAIEFAELEGM